ncbi:ATP-dependent DNA helicase [Trichonephila clavipes]|nr:ATP-dependent DNA helicase [Trichonephila clavipes]
MEAVSWRGIALIWHDSVHRIESISVKLPAKRSYGTAERKMLPLILSWASTVRKMYSSTVDYAVIYLGRNPFVEGEAYVTFNSVKSLDGLLIEELNYSKLTEKVPCNNEALQERDRKRNYRPPSGS